MEIAFAFFIWPAAVCGALVVYALVAGRPKLTPEEKAERDRQAIEALRVERQALIERMERLQESVEAMQVQMQDERAKGAAAAARQKRQARGHMSGRFVHS